NNVFVGDNNFGNLYYFRVNPDRSALVLDNIPDLLIDNEQEQSSIIFGNGFGAITDLETGPDGYLYVTSYDAGTIYRIVPSSVASSSLSAGTEEAGTPMSSIDEQEQDGQDDDEEESASDDDENGDDGNN
ncbi:MAG TPA: hypothetical protein VE548_06345, partial [Nitrososphaeraceae archaeon]|nr:hypothetical protein [Nitrososphaeraceae archaeon]